jgi:hypothetical protein
VLDKKLKPFHALWVPDMPPPNHMTGSMSQLNDGRVEFIGFLSSMIYEDAVFNKNSLLYLLSGPEPARSKFEARLLKIGLIDTFQIKLIRGTKAMHENAVDEINSIDLTTVDEVNRALLTSEIVLCRPGYSTVMDLMTLGKAAIYVPTPGQPEQELLGKQLSKLKQGIVLKEKDLTENTLLVAIGNLRALPKMKRYQNQEFIKVIAQALNEY